MHLWGDEGVDWKSIDEAAMYIGKGLRRWGRMGVRDYKEKYGTVRVYCSLGWPSIHGILWPGYAYRNRRCPSWLWGLNCRMWGGKVSQAMTKMILPYHVWLYRRYYRKAVEKWPHLREEILSAADWDELLEGL